MFIEDNGGGCFDVRRLQPVCVPPLDSMSFLDLAIPYSLYTFNVQIIVLGLPMTLNYYLYAFSILPCLP